MHAAHLTAGLWSADKLAIPSEKTTIMTWSFIFVHVILRTRLVAKSAPTIKLFWSDKKVETYEQETCQKKLFMWMDLFTFFWRTFVFCFLKGWMWLASENKKEPRNERKSWIGPFGGIVCGISWREKKSSNGTNSQMSHSTQISFICTQWNSFFRRAPGLRFDVNKNLPEREHANLSHVSALFSWQKQLVVGKGWILNHEIASGVVDNSNLAQVPTNSYFNWCPLQQRSADIPKTICSAGCCSAWAGSVTEQMIE